MMASGSGKNPNDTETKEQADLLRAESNAAASAATTEPPPLAPQYEIIGEEVHGPPEAGGWNPSAATAAAAGAEEKGEETMSLFRRGSAGGKPPLPPRPPFVSSARGPSSASGKRPHPASPPPPHCPMSEEVLASGMAVRDVFDELMLECQREMSGETGQKDEAERMPRQQNEQLKSPAVRPKKPLWRKCHFHARRNVMIAVLLIVSILLLPAQTEAFQHFDNIEDAAQRLAGLNELGDLRLQLEEEAPVPGAGFSFCLHPVMVAICTFLMLGLFSWFFDPKEEH